MLQLPKKTLSLSIVWVVAIEVLLLVCAVYLHLFSALPIEYSWSRTLELFWQSLTDKYFLVMASVALAAAAAVSKQRPFSASSIRRNEYFVPSLVLVTVTLAIMVTASSHYGAWDYVFLLPVLALTVPALQQRHPVKALAGLTATVVVLVVVSYAFTIFKSQLFVGRPPLDQLIINAEIFLFGQPLYLAIANWASSHPTWVGFSNWVYYLFFHHMALTALFLFACGDTEQQWRYVLSLSLCYMLGGLSYFIFPALGPIYFDPQSFAYLSAHAEFTTSIQEYLRISTEKAIHGNLEVVETFAFIACMPSLHMAHETVMLLYSRRSPLMLLFAGCFWASSFIAVLILGWHYLFDVLGGILLAVLVVGISRKVRLPSSDKKLQKT